MKRKLTNDELLDRYIHSLKTLLPPDRMDDIAAEIRSNLESVVEDQAMQLGREPGPEEMSAILKRYGHPVVVATRYRDQPGRGLISPELFPFYWFTVRAVFGMWVTVRVIIAVFQFQGSMTAGSILLRLGRDVVMAGFGIAAGVTLIFAVWEYLEFRFRYSQRWKPESLPPVPALVRKRQPRPLVQIIGQVVWLIFWAMALFLPAMSWVWGGRGVFSPSDAVYAMRLPIWLLALAGISQEWLKFRLIRVAGVPSRRPVCLGNHSRDLHAARGGSTDSGSQVGSHSGQAVGHSESDGWRSFGAGLYFCRPVACA